MYTHTHTPSTKRGQRTWIVELAKKKKKDKNGNNGYFELQLATPLVRTAALNSD